MNLQIFFTKDLLDTRNFQFRTQNKRLSTIDLGDLPSFLEEGDLLPEDGPALENRISVTSFKLFIKSAISSFESRKDVFINGSWRSDSQRDTPRFGGSSIILSGHVPLKNFSF